MTTTSNTFEVNDNVKVDIGDGLSVTGTIIDSMPESDWYCVEDNDGDLHEVGINKLYK